jgi:hypothetical protein
VIISDHLRSEDLESNLHVCHVYYYLSTIFKVVPYVWGWQLKSMIVFLFWYWCLIDSHHMEIFSLRFKNVQDKYKCQPSLIIQLFKFELCPALFAFLLLTCCLFNHRTRKINLDGEDLGKTKLRSSRGGAWRKNQKRTYPGGPRWGEEGLSHSQLNNCESNSSDATVLFSLCTKSPDAAIFGFWVGAMGY